MLVLRLAARRSAVSAFSTLSHRALTTKVSTTSSSTTQIKDSSSLDQDFHAVLDDILGSALQDVDSPLEQDAPVLQSKKMAAPVLDQEVRSTQPTLPTAMTLPLTLPLTLYTGH